MIAYEEAVVDSFELGYWLRRDAAEYFDGSVEADELEDYILSDLNDEFYNSSWDDEFLVRTPEGSAIYAELKLLRSLTREFILLNRERPVNPEGMARRFRESGEYILSIHDVLATQPKAEDDKYWQDEADLSAEREREQEKIDTTLSLWESEHEFTPPPGFEAKLCAWVMEGAL